MSSSSNPKVAILDAGSQYGKEFIRYKRFFHFQADVICGKAPTHVTFRFRVIDRRIRELKVESEILPLSTTAEALVQQKYKAIVISGGPSSVNESNLKFDMEIFRCGLPVLGICYGFHMLVKCFGGEVKSSGQHEDGQFTVGIDTSCALFGNLERKQTVLMTHGDSVTGSGADRSISIIASSEGTGLVAGVSIENKPLYGLQFHPEVDLTENGRIIFKNFLFNICKLKPTFVMNNRMSDCISYIRQKVGNKKVLILLSGGVDSTVCAALVKKALDSSERIIALHIDNGFMRKKESSNVIDALKKLKLHIEFRNASRIFYNSKTVIPSPDGDLRNERQTGLLNCVIDPEDKRKIIGDTFMKLVDDLISSLGLSKKEVILAQGTLRPDLIESASIMASSHADTIKTHHNDTQLVRSLRAEGRVCEPLSSFHKDEVRELGRRLNLPDSIIERHPFPGPGLAIRILCSDGTAFEGSPSLNIAETSQINVMKVKFRKLSNESTSDYDIINSVLTNGCSPADQKLVLELRQTLNFAIQLLPIVTVGIHGDVRSYRFVAGISSSFPKMMSSPSIWKSLREFTRVILGLSTIINRVVYIFGPKVDYIIKDTTSTYLTTHVLNTLREADYQATSVLTERNLLRKIHQMPVVLVPLHFDRDPDVINSHPSCRRSVVLRPFITHDFMTGLPAIPGQDLPLADIEEMVNRITSLVPGISRVMYDLTSKPPGTTEWE